MTTARVGVVVDAIDIEAWQEDVIERLQATLEGDLASILVLRGPSPAAAAPLGRWSRPRLRRRRGGWRPPGPILTVAARPVAGGGSDIDAADTTTLRTLDLDVLVWLGAGVPAGTMLDVARWGTLYFRYGGQDGVSVDHAVLASLVRGEPTVRADLVRRAPEGGREGIVRSGWFATSPASYGRSRDRVLDGIGSWPAGACREGDSLIDAPAGPIGANDAEAGRSRTGRLDAARLMSVMASAWLARLWHHGWRHDDWAVGVLERPVASLLERPTVEGVHWAPPIAGHYTADPFGRWQGEALEVVYEDFDHAHGRAAIAARIWSRPSGWGEPGTVLDIGSHQSYPFLLIDGDRELMMPESQASGSLVIYASQDGGTWLPWRTVDIPMTVADATLLHRDGRWWLFGCRADRLNPATELWLWHAETLEGPWVEHPQDPVVTDVRAARPAGPLFEASGSLYRPAQDCSTGYGDRLAIREVTELTVERYAERTVTVIEPERDGPYPLGLHTLTSVGDVTLIDGKRRVRHLGATVRAIRRHLGGR